MSVRPGSVLDDRYSIDAGPLTRDGLGETWRATDTVLGRPVTITVLRADLAGDDAFVRWWQAESRKAAGRPPAPDETLQVCNFGRSRYAAPDGVTDVVYQVALRIDPDVRDQSHQRPRPDLPRTPPRPSTWEGDLDRRVKEITDPDETLQYARRQIQLAHDSADSGASERDALVLMTTAAETYDALDAFIRTTGRLPTAWNGV